MGRVFRAVVTRECATLRVDSNKRMAADNVSGHGKDISFYNGLGHAVDVTDVLGVRTTIPSNTRRKADGIFEVVVVYRWNHNVNVDISSVSSGVAENQSKVRRALIDALDNSRDMMDKFRRTRSLHISFTREDLRDNGGAFYIREIDMVVSDADLESVIIHPRSEESNIERLFARDKDEAREGFFGFNIKLVDNHGRHGTQYLNLNGVVHDVHPVSAPGVEDGVYVLTRPPATAGANFPSTPVMEWCSLEEARKKYRLYGSYREADSLGDWKAEQERKREEATQQFKTKDMENVQVMTEIKRESDLISHHRNMEMLLRKERSEEVSLSRREHTEFWKSMPAVLTAIGAILAGLKAFSMFGNKN
ncbi:hypothetical protein Xoosp14_122 [Xanthomonas phage Xoo-sp14]|nr:hypothetical protein Xoosp14_122 [Xanthomonas phage Xoo-sp14]